MMREPVAVLALLLHLTYSFAMDNEVYKGCGFDSVPGQPQALKFCTAYGLCIKTHCGPGRVFSRSHCGCVQALSLKPYMSTPTPVTSRPDVRNIGEYSWTTHLPGAEAGVKDDNRAADTLIITASNQDDNSSSSKINAEIARSDSGKEITGNRALLSQNASGKFATSQPKKENMLSQLSPNRVSPKKTQSNVKISKGMVNSSSEIMPILRATLGAPALTDSFPVVDQLTAETRGTGHEGKTNYLSMPEATDPQRIQAIRYRGEQHNPGRGSERGASSIVPAATVSQQFQNKSLTGTNLNVESAATKTYVLPTAAAGLATNTTQKEHIQHIVSTAIESTTDNPPQNTTSPQELACGPEISITGMSTGNVLISDGVLGTDYIGVRSVTSKNGSAHFNGNGFLWMPFSDNNRFATGITIMMTFKENDGIQVSQGLINNCGHDSMSSISVSLHPDTRQVKFKAVVTSTNTPYSLQEIVEASIPYTPGVSKTLEMQCNGQSLIVRLDNYVSGNHLPLSESYELLPGIKPLYVGKRCPEEETDNFYGDISNFALYRCVRT